MRRHKGNILFITSSLGLLGLTIISGHMLTSSRASAESSRTTPARVTVTSSCELDAVVNTAHEAEVVASTYRDNIGKTTITATCNDANGYAVYAVGYTNTEFGRNDMLGANTGRTIETGTAISGTASNWAMKLTSVPGEVAPTITDGYSSYHAVPDDYVKVASYASSTAGSNTGSQFETTYATFVASTQAPDVYNGKVKYTLVHPNDSSSAPCTDTYTIIYNNNGGSGTMDSQVACVDTAIRLLPDGFTPPAPISDNQFAVWNTAADGSGYTYNANQSVTNIASAGGSVTLYAQWAPKYMQDLTNPVCQIVASQNPFIVYDRRDGNDYTVRYLNGACWMTQNLRITGTVNKQYSNFTRVDNFEPCTGDLTSGDSYDEPRCHDSGNKSNGVWYNYAAATAGQIVTNNNRTLATQDICPLGWSMPSDDSSNNSSPAGSVDSMVTSVSTEVSAFSPIAGGYYTGGLLKYENWSRWWSTAPSIYVGYGRHGLRYDGSKLEDSDGDAFNRNLGFYIRCTRVQ